MKDSSDGTVEPVRYRSFGSLPALHVRLVSAQIQYAEGLLLWFTAVLLLLPSPTPPFVSPCTT